MSISLSKWPMLPTIAWCFIRAMCSAVMMSLLPVAVMKMSAVSTTSSSVSDLVALHRRLQRADRVDLGDDHAGALAAQRLGAALADVAVAADDGDLAADHHVGGAVDAVDQRVAAAVEVVELRLGDRVVDVDRREQQRAGLVHLVEAVHAGGGLLGDALDALADARSSAAGPRRASAASSVEDDLALLGVGRRRASGTAPAASNSAPLCTSSVASPPSSRIMFGPSPSGQRSACSVHHQYSSSVSPFQAKTGTPCGSSACRRADGDRGGGVVLGARRCCRSAQRTSAPSATSVSISTAVWIVMCSEPVIRAPLSGWLRGVLRAERPSGRASRARRAGSPCGRSRRARGRRP